MLSPTADPRPRVTLCIRCASPDVSASCSGSCWRRTPSPPPATTASIGSLRPQRRTARQGRRLGADQRETGRDDTRPRAGQGRRHRDRSGIWRRPDGDRRRQARRDRAWHRIQPGHGGVVEDARGRSRRLGARDVYRGGPVRQRLHPGHRDHDVPPARHQPAIAAADPGPGAGHAHRLEHLHDGRLGARTGPRPSPTASAGVRRCCGSCRPKCRARGKHPMGH